MKKGLKFSGATREESWDTWDKIYRTAQIEWRVIWREKEGMIAEIFPGGKTRDRKSLKQERRKESQSSQELFEEVTPLFSQRALERGAKG